MSAAVMDPYSLKFLHFNDEAAHSLGYTREEFSRLSVPDIDDSYAFSQQDFDRMRAGQRLVLEGKHKTKTGARRDVVVYIRQMTLGGRLVANCLWQDVTDKKAAEAALLQSEKLASVGRMAASVAHEINNPLALITNCVYLVRHSPGLSDDMKEYLEVAERELRRVALITKRTLGFYREDTHPSVVDLPALVDEVAELYTLKLVRMDIRLKVEHKGRQYRTMAVPGEIRQVISNLLTNAIDASPAHSSVTIRVMGLTLNGCGVTRLSVADRGLGIPPEDRKHIFEPFFTTKKAVGTGLGLWVSRTIVQKHNGKIRLRSSEGRGTVFSVFLPCQET
jgi:PAS domain S-box-containing protein